MYHTNEPYKSVDICKERVSAALSAQREEIKELVKGMELEENKKVRDSGNWDLVIGYNSALTDILSKL